MQTKDLVSDGNFTIIQKSLAVSLVTGAILTTNIGVSASAEGTVATTSHSTTEVTPASDTPVVDSSTIPSDTPVVPDAPKTEEKPEVKPSEEVPTTPSDTPTVPDAPKTEKKPEVKPSVTEVTEKPKPAVYVPKPYENGTGSETVLHPQASGTPTVTPTNNEPVVTDEGYKIVDIYKSLLTLENADGSRIQVKPELIGGVTNEDGTVTVKSSKGGLETLPETGFVESMLMTLIGFLLLIFGFSLLNKGKQNVYTYL